MIASTKVTERAQQRWDAIVERFRAACILHRDGKESESRRIIREELPPMIRVWMQLLPSGLKEDAKADLRDMFNREQALVNQGLKLQQVLKELIVNQVIPQIEETVSAKYRALYLSKLRHLTAEKDKVRSDDSWVRPSYSDQPHPSNAWNAKDPNKRIKIDDVSSMIDAVQENDHEAIAESVLTLQNIVDGMNQSQIGHSMPFDQSFEKQQ